MPTPKAVLQGLGHAPRDAADFDRVSVGFPGVIKHGVTYTAVNLHPGLGRISAADGTGEALEEAGPRGNDAAVQGYGAIKGRRRGDDASPWARAWASSLFTDGRLVPGAGTRPSSLEEDTPTRTTSAGAAWTSTARRRGTSCCRRRSRRPPATFNWDHLYLGGGNTKKIDFKLPKNAEIVSNETGLLGGVALWKDDALAAKKG